MQEYEFHLTFAIPEEISDDSICEALGGGCNDALLGLGRKGFIGLDFMRIACSPVEAVQSAYKDVKGAIQDAVLMGARPDFAQDILRAAK